MFAIVICGGCPGTSVQGGKCPEFQGLSRDGAQREIDSSWFYSGDPAADVTTCRRFANIRRPPPRGTVPSTRQLGVFVSEHSE